MTNRFAESEPAPLLVTIAGSTYAVVKTSSFAMKPYLVADVEAKTIHVKPDCTMVTLFTAAAELAKSPQ